MERTKTEPWMRGPVDSVPPLLQPVAHALIHVHENLHAVVPGLETTQLWSRPAGAASIGFHLRHIGASLDRLFTYARGEQLSEKQRSELKNEGEPGTPPADAASLLSAVDDRIEAAMAQLRETREDTLLEGRVVGRYQLPSTVLGLLFHAAEHAQRHVGQVVTTARIVAPHAGPAD